jgi:acetyl-CoA synthetase
VLITRDGGTAAGSVLPLKRFADEAIAGCPRSARHRAYVDAPAARARGLATMKEGRDHWWHRLLEQASPVCPAEPMDAEAMLFILYTSGTTGKPKGIVHTTCRIPHPGRRNDQVRVRSEG